MSDKQRASNLSFAIMTLVSVGYYEVALAQPATVQLARDQRAAFRPPPERGETVTNRARPELDPLGVRAGGLFIYPRLGLQEFYNDNIFAIDSGEQDDFITLITPRVDVTSDWTKHAFDLYAKAAIARYADQTVEDFEDFSVGTNGRLDITQRTNLRAGVNYDRLHEGRGSPDDIRRQGGSPPVEPTIFDVGSAFLTYQQWLGRFLLESGGVVDRLGYDNVKRENGDTIINDDRDRVLISGNLKVGYEFMPGYTAFARGEVDYRRYDNLCCDDFSQFDRDSEGYLIEVGTDFDVTAVLFGNVAIGYRSQDYDDPRFDTIGDVAGRASLTWNPTGLTTVSAAITRGEVVETTLSGSAAIFETAGQVTLDHELLRNLLLQAAVSVGDDDFQDIDRSDTYVRAGFGAKYLMNRYIHLDLSYGYLSRGSSAQGGDFTSNTIFLGALFRI
ncbi:MAG: outer membrane beta-barrel protein [Gammaproteobacteria bacterium]